MKVTTTTRQGCVLLCVGAMSVLVPAEAAGAAPACRSSEARQADEAAAAYLVSQAWEPSWAAAVVRKLNEGGRHCR